MRLLSEDLPLRTTADLGNFAQSELLPHRIGDMRGLPSRCVRLSPTEFLWADHPARVTGVRVEGVATTAVDVVIRPAAGVAATIIRFVSAPAEGAVVTAEGIGREAHANGRTIENPADVIQYGLGLGGRQFPATVMSPFRAECSAADLRLVGSIDKLQSTRAWIETWCSSAGAIWTPSYIGLYPALPPSAFRYTLDFTNSRPPEATADLSNAARSLKLSYARDAANDRFTGVVQVSARGTNFVNDMTQEAPWLNGAGSAVRVATCFLQRLAQGIQPVRIDVDVPSAAEGGWTAIQPGAWVYLNHSPLTGALKIIGREWAPGGRTAVLAGELWAPTIPPVTLVSHSTGVAIVGRPFSEVAVRLGTVIVTVYDENDRRLPGAHVALDNGPVKVTDARGEVTFRATPGEHVAHVSGGSFEPYDIGVTV